MSASQTHARIGSSTSHAALKIGAKARFIRWIHTRDGWYPEIIQGTYRGRETGSWRVDIEGGEQVLFETTWAIYRP